MSTQTFGRYEIKREIGRGGMATVYLAYDPRFRREVALKAMPHQFTHDPMFRTRFEREAQTIAALEHPAIVPVHDFGEENGQPFIVMRYMSGGSLSDRLKQGRLSLVAAEAVLTRIASALDRAHGIGVVHRDLKPGNILFDQYGDAYLADFGIAKIAEATAALTGSGLVGTPSYMSPEQVKGEEVDGRSDIYSLGIILYEMLSGAQPYQATTPWGILSKHVNAPIPHILEQTADLPPQLDTIVTRALAKEATDRFQTASELASAVTLMMQQRPYSSTPTIVSAAPEPETPLPPPPETIPTAPAEPTPVTVPAPVVAEPEATVTEVAPPTRRVEPLPDEIKPPPSPPKAASPPVETAVAPSRPGKLAAIPVWGWLAGGAVLLVLLVFLGRALRPEAVPAGTPTATSAALSANVSTQSPAPEPMIAGEPLSDFIQVKWDEGFRITDLAYGDDAWATIMSQNSPYGRQTWKTSALFPGDTIQEKWDEGFRVTNLTYGSGLWLMALSQQSPYGRQTYKTARGFPGDYIQQKWDEGFRVTSLTYGNGAWAVVLSADAPYGRQTWKTSAAFPGDYIQEKWDEGFRVTSLAYGDGAWAVVLSQDSRYGRQTWKTSAAFPGDYMQQKWNEGFRVTSLAFGGGVWAVMMAQESPYGRQIYRMTPDF
ncbi:MAG: serine/threonine protein kinase [Anaerolineae bacterium]|nr:serine/threonine protein kinase [Anaerolineae bacterium]